MVYVKKEVAETIAGVAKAGQVVADSSRGEGKPCASGRLAALVKIS
jgi:hypothetical protein